MRQWLDIEGLSNYEVSDRGEIRNKSTGQILKPIDNKRGTMMVILRSRGQGYSRAIRRLVLNAFDPIGDEHDAVPIHLDTDYKNCALDNLEWKSRWHAVMWTSQNKRSESLRQGRIQDATSGDEWESALDAAKELRTLEHHILNSAFNGTSHKGRYFRFI